MNPQFKEASKQDKTASPGPCLSSSRQAQVTSLGLNCMYGKIMSGSSVTISFMPLVVLLKRQERQEGIF